MAAIMVVVMLVTMIPLGTLVNVFAAAVDGYTVTLTDGSSTIDLDGVEITLTNKADNDKSSTKNTVNGVATFENFVQEDETYTVSVAEKIGYEVVADFEITPASGDANTDVSLVAIPKVELKGTVTDEDGNPYKDATVKVTGYITETTATNADGEYSFTAYKGKDYTITATAKEAKYEKASTTISSLSATQPASSLQFAIKTFNITTNSDSHGDITETSTVKYNDSKEVTATAKDGYRIDSFKVDGVEQTSATAQKEYSYSFSNITASHSVVVSFKRQTYKISFTVDENGKVEYTDGTKQTVAGGSVNLEKEFNESTDPTNPTKVIVEVIPNPTYRVSKISYKGDLEADKKEEKNYTENNKSLEGSEAIALEMNKNYTFEAEFALNQYDINIDNETDKGTVTVSGSTNKVATKANYGDELKFQIKNTQGYIINEVKVNDVTTAYEYDNDAAAYVVIVKDVSDTINFNVSYEINDKLYSFKDNVKLEIKNGTKSIVFNDGTNELNSISELNSSNTDGLVVKTVGNTIVLKSGSQIVFTNQNKDKRGRNQNIELQFVYSQFKTNDNGWYNPRSSSVTVSKSFELTNVQVKPNDRNTINPQDAIKASDQPVKYTIVIDNDVPEISVSESEFKWTNANNVEITGTVTDKNEEKNPSSGLSYIVWNKDATLNNDAVLNATENKVAIADGKFSFNSVDGEQNSTYYIYAVDVAGNVSSAKAVKVKIDKTAPVVKNISKVPNREWTNENTIVSGEVSDSNETDSNIVSKINRVVYTTNASLTNEEIKALGSDNTATLSGNEYSFNLTESQTEIYYVYAIDNAGNVSKAESIDVKITRVLPIINSVEKEPSKDWHNDNVKVSVNASIETGASPIDRVVYTTSNDLDDDAIRGLSTVAQLESGKYVFTIDKSVEQNQTYYVYAIDKANNISLAKDIVVRIDTAEPNIDGFAFEKLNASAPAKVINFLTFGLFCNEEIKVTATVSDTNGNANSQCNKIVFQMYSDNALGNKFGKPISVDVNVDENNTYTASTTIPMDFKGVIKAVVYDNAGNASAETMASKANCFPNTENDKMKDDNGLIMTEKQPPHISDITVNTTTPTANTKNWYNSKDITIPFDVTDETNGDINSGLYSVVVNAYYNQSEKAYQTVTFNEGLGIDKDATKAEPNRHIDLTFGTDSDDNIPYQGDGQYKISVLVTDNCGNTATKEFTYYVDTTAAKIVSFELGKDSEGVVEETDYGYYFKNDVDVIVTVDDTVEGVKDISDACEVRYYTVDYSEPDKPVASGSTTEGYTVAEYKADQHQAIIPIRGNFKGQIYAWVIDNADNTSILAYNGTSIAPVKPDGSILESAAKHNDEEHIKFTKEASSFTTEDGTELYAGKVPVTINVIDTYSGIREIEWSVVAPYDTDNNQSGKVTVNNDKTYTDDSEEGWKQIKTENNLVTEMERKITVNNNSNNIKVTVKMTDRAGNTSEQEIEFSIDTTKPAIEVTYDNNTPDESYKDIYKANRKATVKITERNFNEKDVIYNITNTDGVIPTISSWEAHKNTEAPDETYYTATIDYVADGDYTFDISYSDRAENPADKFAQHAFTIDKTAPVLTSVVYDNDDALKDGNNYRYFKADRTATITITEHNFDASRVEVIGTATDNGNPITFPAQLNADVDWEDKGDVHVAKINYSIDAKYTFEIKFLDMAGNAMDEVPVDEFCIDKTAPTLEITGVEDKSANNGTVAPIVTCTDTNFNKDAVKIELIGAKNSKVDYESSTKAIDNGQELTYKDFEKVQKVDDIYTLQATLTDYAGNETSKVITFSANRFGSVYTFDRYLLGIEGKFTNVKEDIIFTETNVDTLEKGSVKLTLFKDGTPVDLKEGTDYDVDPSGGNGKWSQYKYTVHKSLIDSDGKYRLRVLSKDIAGNNNDNTDETKSAEISFGIDTTKPIIVPIDLENGEQYPVEVKTVKAEIKDNLVLDKVTIYYGNEVKPGNEIKYTVEGETYTFDIPQKNEKQSVLFVATDAAGNIHELVVEDFLVTTNWFVRWYNNTPLFIGSIVGVVVVAIGVSAFIVFGKKKKKDDDEETQTF
ncbi:carboxypeptidase-like regulatory domain-containing protein [uncultured Eubacterium sp.]|uniref:carboxypeptidase-like regulatory domain-containing protein n=1 Tax=uncultured Eubacterium sp. TaxID=165185 RepID=UPI0025DDC3DF|nr:carboxypeptidase-like regulatory domain-containing protein [uncultured Eubacterium sp.]